MGAFQQLAGPEPEGERQVGGPHGARLRVAGSSPSRGVLRMAALALLGLALAALFPARGSAADDLPLLRDFTIVTDSGCSGCTAVWGGDELEATVAGAGDAVDSAYGSYDFGGTAGWAGRVWTRTIVRLPAGETVSGELTVFQVRDVNDALVYELYVDEADRTLRLFSPAGGLRSSAIDQSTGVVVPNDGTTSLRAEVEAARNEGVKVRIDGLEQISLSGFSGATSGNQRWARAGIVEYDGSSSASVRIFHRSVGVTTWSGWGRPASPPATCPRSRPSASRPTAAAAPAAPAGTGWNWKP